MTLLQARQYDRLINGLWEGDVPEWEFIEVGMDMGASWDAIQAVLNDIRLEDRTL